MVNDWVEMTLEESMDAIIDYRGKTPKKTDFGIPLITAKIIKSGRIETVNEFISEDDYDTWMRRGIPNKGDIVMTTEAPLGEIAQLDERKIALAQRVITLRGKKDVLDNTFLKYLMISEYVQHQLDGRGTGTTVKGIKQSELRKVMLKFPSFTEQKAIAHILGSLDDKIELNRQMNETLEAMAQALFKSWFVDFDPVIDNALAAGNAIPDEFIERAEQRKGIEKKENSDIQDLFPDAFEFTEEMGWIPRGWEVATLESLAVISSSKRIFAKEYKTEGIPFFRGKEISLLSKGESFTQDIFISKERFSELKNGFGAPTSGDLLLTSVGTIGNVYLVQEDDEFYFKDGNLTWFSKYKTEIRGAYLSTWFNTRQAYLAIENIKIGSTQQAITISSLNGIKIVKPKDKIVSLFNEFSENIVKKTSILIKERRTLTKLRDTLLPKLMSGELRLDEVEILDEL